MNNLFIYIYLIFVHFFFFFLFNQIYYFIHQNYNFKHQNYNLQQNLIFTIQTFFILCFLVFRIWLNFFIFLYHHYYILIISIANFMIIIKLYVINAKLVLFHHLENIYSNMSYSQYSLNLNIVIFFPQLLNFT